MMIHFRCTTVPLQSGTDFGIGNTESAELFRKLDYFSFSAGLTCPIFVSVQHILSTKCLLVIHLAVLIVIIVNFTVNFTVRPPVIN